MDLSRRGFLDSKNIATIFAHCRMHSITDPQERDVVLSGVANRIDLAFKATLAKSSRNKDSVDSTEDRRHDEEARHPRNTAGEHRSVLASSEEAAHDQKIDRRTDQTRPNPRGRGSDQTSCEEPAEAEDQQFGPKDDLAHCQAGLHERQVPQCPHQRGGRESEADHKASRS